MLVINDTYLVGFIRVQYFYISHTSKYMPYAYIQQSSALIISTQHKQTLRHGSSPGFRSNSCNKRSMRIDIGSSGITIAVRSFNHQAVKKLKPAAFSCKDQESGKRTAGHL